MENIAWNGPNGAGRICFLLIETLKGFGFWDISPNRACGVGVLTELVKTPTSSLRGGWRSTLIDKNAYLVTPALVSPTRNRCPRAQTWKNTIENQYFLVESFPEARWFFQNLSFRCGRPPKSRKNVKRKQHFDNIWTPLSHLRLLRQVAAVAAVAAVADPQQILQTLCSNSTF